MISPPLTVFIPIKDTLHPATRYALLKAEYAGEIRFVVHQSSREIKHDNRTIQKYINCSNTRNEAKKKALDRGEDWFVSMDSDVVPPADFLDRFAWSINHTGPGGAAMSVVGGWYPIKTWMHKISFNPKTKEREEVTFRNYVAGRWLSDGRFAHYIRPQTQSWERSAQAPLGCCLMHRSVLEMTEFRPGCDRSTVDAETGRECYIGECLEFGNQLGDLNEDVWMHPSVICKHV